MIADQDVANAMAIELLNIKAFKINLLKPFKWTSGLETPIYCDNRLTLSSIYLRSRIQLEMAILILKKYSKAECIAGVATAGIPHATLVAHELKLPLVYVRSQPKKHGLKRQIEGQLIDNPKVVVIEDLISTGGSAAEATKILSPYSKVLGLCSIMSYDFKEAEENFKSLNLEYYSLTNCLTLFSQALKKNQLSQQDYQELLEWHKNPKLWKPKNL